MLIKVVSVIETIVQIDVKEDTLVKICDRAKQVILDDSYGVIRTDLQVCEKDAVVLTATPVITKYDLPTKSKDCYAWTEDVGQGDTTDKTCGEILDKE